MNSSINRHQIAAKPRKSWKQRGSNQEMVDRIQSHVQNPLAPLPLTPSCHIYVNWLFPSEALYSIATEDRSHELNSFDIFVTTWGESHVPLRYDRWLSTKCTD